MTGAVDQTGAFNAAGVQASDENLAASHIRADASALLSIPLQSHRYQCHHHHSTYSVPGTTLSASHVLFN